MTSPKDIEKLMREAAIQDAAHTRERFGGAPDEVYGRMKRGLPDALRAFRWYSGAKFDKVEFDDDLRRANITIGVKRGTLISNATVSDAGLVDGSPESDISIEFAVIPESKWRQPEPMSVGGAMTSMKAVVWGDYLNG